MGSFGGNRRLRSRVGKLRTANPRFQQKVRSIDLYRSLLILVAFILLYLPIDFAASLGQDGTIAAHATQSITTSNGHVGSKVCAQCHQRIYDQFSRTGMGRSMTQVTSALLETLPAKASFHQKNPDRDFEVFAQDGKLYQGEYEADANGKEIFRDTHEVEWIIGSGANGFGGVVRKGDYLFQAPLSFYSKPHSWALSPGYEFGNYGFNRPILAGCIYCHSGQPRPVSNGNGRFKEPPFSEMAIGCENCHGPGITHTLKMRARKAGNVENDPSIINPAHLALALSDNICMSCHQTGDVRVLKPGKDYGDFLPGAPLENTLSILMIPPNRESPPQSDHLEHYYSMTLSQCYRKSGGRLGCTTCHDPHFEPSHEEASGYFNKKCMACHTEKSCGASLEIRRHKNPPNDCAGCHMPKRDVHVISHSSLTNHRILKQVDEPFPDAAFHQATQALPDLIHLNPIPGHKDTPPPPLTLLQAYGELMEKKPEYLGRYLALLGQLERMEPGSALVQAALGRRDLRLGKFPEAVVHLQSALRIGPPQTAAYADLAESLVRLDRAEEAMPWLEKAIELDPFNSTLQRTRVLRLIEVKRYADARAAMQHYLERFPEDSFMRQMLARADQITVPARGEHP